MSIHYSEEWSHRSASLVKYGDLSWLQMALQNSINYQNLKMIYDGSIENVILCRLFVFFHSEWFLLRATSVPLSNFPAVFYRITFSPWGYLTFAETFRDGSIVFEGLLSSSTNKNNKMSTFRLRMEEKKVFFFNIAQLYLFLLGLLFPSFFLSFFFPNFRCFHYFAQYLFNYLYFFCFLHFALILIASTLSRRLIFPSLVN